MEHRKRKRKHPTKLLGTPEYLGDINIPTSIEMIQYDKKEYVHKTLDIRDDLKKQIKDGFVSWFQITGISDVNYISKIFESFGLYNFDIRELLADSGTVKIVLYDNVTFVLTSAFYTDDEKRMNDIQTAFILGENFIISIKESHLPIFKEVEKAIADNILSVRDKEADFLLYMLLHAVNSFNNNFILDSEDSLLDIEDQLILQQETPEILHILRVQRKNYISLKRFIASLRDEIENLLENSNHLVRKDTLIYFENLDDKYRTTANSISNYEDTVKSLLELFYNNNSTRMNEIMKRLTLVATIFIPLTFLAGVWGMNFTVMPELKWKYGYLFAWILFAVIAIIVIFLLRKRKWF